MAFDGKDLGDALRQSLTPLVNAALRYARVGLSIHPCKPWPDKSALIKDWPHKATRNPEQIKEWFGRAYPQAVIGVVTGAPSGVVVLDIDVKRGVNGWKTLAALEGCPIAPPVPTVITASGGAHLYFIRPEGGLRNTAGQRGRGIGPGLDWRGDHGYVLVPSPGKGYRWSTFHFGNCAPLPVPPELMPRDSERLAVARLARPLADGLSPYATAALDDACRQIIDAPAGEQEVTLNAECFAIGTLAGAGGIPEGFALRAMLWAAAQVRNHDHRRPWRADELANKVKRAFAQGYVHPRGGGRYAA